MVDRNEKKRITHDRIIAAANRGFRRRGYGGIGVDGLAKDAGVTSGAFYVHFHSKQDAFRESIRRGLADLNAGVLHFQSTHQANWWREFVIFYLSTKRTCDLSDSCALQSLPTEVARLDRKFHAEFEKGLRAVAATIAKGPPSPAAPSDEKSAYLSLAFLTGAVTMARAIADDNLAASIAEGAMQQLLECKETKATKSMRF